MKLHWLLLVLLEGMCAMDAKSQTPGKRYYYKDNQGLTGVKDSKGAIIIPPVYHSYADTGLIDDGLILLLDTVPDNRPGISSSLVYFDRNGKQLVHPFIFDNGPDYLAEGLFRIVENGKIGFADREGKVVIRPQFGFASPFVYGLSFFCNECRFYRDSMVDDEHNLRLTESAWGIVDKTGNIVKAATDLGKIQAEDQSLNAFMDVPLTSDRLYVTDSLLATISSPFIYTAEEELILQKVRKQPQLGSTTSINLSKDATTKMVYEIVERPRASFPYYWIEAYHVIDGTYTNAEEHFLVSLNGSQLYRYQPSKGTKDLIRSWTEKMKVKKMN